jgi:hypothetical protein
MVHGAENLPRIKLLAEIGDSCALHKNIEPRTMNYELKGKIYKIPFLFSVLGSQFEVLVQGTRLVGERLECSEVGL